MGGGSIEFMGCKECLKKDEQIRQLKQIIKLSNAVIDELKDK